MRIPFVTSNKNKYQEAREIVGRRLVRKELETEEIQSVDVEKVVLHKLNEAHRKLKGPLVVEDTGLHLDALRGFPGALIKHMENSMGVEEIPRLLSYYGNFNAAAETAIGFHDGKKAMLFVSVTRGKIVRKPRGSRGFGFDSIFVPEGSKKTLAQMSVHEKNIFSARGKAFRKLEVYLMKNKI